MGQSDKEQEGTKEPRRKEYLIEINAVLSEEGR